MNFAAAIALRDEFLVHAEMVIGRAAGKKRFLPWLVGWFKSIRDLPPSPLNISIGVRLGPTPNDCGIAVRSTMGIDPLETLFLSGLRDRGALIDVRIIQPVTPEQFVGAKGPMSEPPRIGSAIGHPLDGPGTLGAFARVAPSNRIALLSNNHVLARADSAAIGARTMFHWKNPDLSQRQIGTLADHEKLKKIGAGVNQMDAAISVISELPLDPGDVGGRIRLTGHTAVPTEQMIVAKYGAMTGYTEGTLTSVRHNGLEISYNDKTCRFDGQMEISSSTSEPFSMKGDSGSLVVTTNGDAIGLLFAGADEIGGNSRISFANPIGPVLQRFGLVLLH